MVSFAFWERVGVHWGVLMATDPIWPEMEQVLLSFFFFQRGATLELSPPLPLPLPFSPTLSLLLDFFCLNFFLL